MKRAPHLLLALLPVLALPVQAATRPAKPAAAKAAPAKPAAAPAKPVATSDTPETLAEQSRDAQARGEAELAVRLAQAALVADPARSASYVALGDLYAAAGQNEFARSYYDAALEVDPANAGAAHAIAALGTAKTTAANRP